ncbi:MAG: hypothetical protein HY319_08855 [Armatimonadetes bacterium]|nr:hypothetical protein [Armatimonadota bacterium]
MPSSGAAQPTFAQLAEVAQGSGAGPAVLTFEQPAPPPSDAGPSLRRVYQRALWQELERADLPELRRLSEQRDEPAIGRIARARLLKRLQGDKSPQAWALRDGPIEGAVHYLDLQLRQIRSNHRRGPSPGKLLERLDLLEQAVGSAPVPESALRATVHLCAALADVEKSRPAAVRAADLVDKWARNGQIEVRGEGLRSAMMQRALPVRGSVVEIPPSLPVPPDPEADAWLAQLREGWGPPPLPDRVDARLAGNLLARMDLATTEDLLALQRLLRADRADVREALGAHRERLSSLASEACALGSYAAADLAAEVVAEALEKFPELPRKSIVMRELEPLLHSPGDRSGMAAFLDRVWNLDPELVSPATGALVELLGHGTMKDNEGWVLEAAAARGWKPDSRQLELLASFLLVPPEAPDPRAFSHERHVAGHLFYTLFSSNPRPLLALELPDGKGEMAPLAEAVVENLLQSPTGQQLYSSIYHRDPPIGGLGCLYRLLFPNQKLAERLFREFEDRRSQPALELLASVPLDEEHQARFDREVAPCLSQLTDGSMAPEYRVLQVEKQIQQDPDPRSAFGRIVANIETGPNGYQYATTARLLGAWLGAHAGGKAAGLCQILGRDSSKGAAALHRLLSWAEQGPGLQASLDEVLARLEPEVPLAKMAESLLIESVGRAGSRLGFQELERGIAVSEFESIPSDDACKAMLEGWLESWAGDDAGRRQLPLALARAEDWRAPVSLFRLMEWASRNGELGPTLEAFAAACTEPVRELEPRVRRFYHQKTVERVLGDSSAQAVSLLRSAMTTPDPFDDWDPRTPGPELLKIWLEKKGRAGLAEGVSDGSSAPLLTALEEAAAADRLEPTLDQLESRMVLVGGPAQLAAAARIQAAVERLVDAGRSREEATEEALRGFLDAPTGQEPPAATVTVEEKRVRVGSVWLPRRAVASTLA